MVLQVGKEAFTKKKKKKALHLLKIESLFINLVAASIA